MADKRIVHNGAQTNHRQADGPVRPTVVGRGVDEHIVEHVKSRFGTGRVRSGKETRIRVGSNVATAEIVVEVEIGKLRCSPHGA